MEYAENKREENGQCGSGEQGSAITHDSDPIELALSDIEVDPTIQPRVQLNAEVVDEYARCIREGDVFPPLIVHFFRARYWLTDGFHRRAAYQEAGVERVRVEVRLGDRRAAILDALEANRCHGLRYTNEEKRLNVLLLLDDDEWQKYGQRTIARKVGVTQGFVSKLVKERRDAQRDNSHQPPDADGGPGQRDDDQDFAQEEGEDQGGDNCNHPPSVQREGRWAGKKSGKRGRGEKNPNLKDLEKRLSRSLGAKVTVTDRKGRGYIKISYSTSDEREQMLNVLLGE